MRSTTRRSAASRRSTRCRPSSGPRGRTTASSPAALARFGFAQWEFPGRLGPDPGRYVVRRFAGDEVRRILVIDGIEAPRKRRRGARPRRATSAPVAVEVTRATVVDATPLGSLEAADDWLERAAGPDGERFAADALALLNRAVAGHRVAAAEAWVADAVAARASVFRVGYGSGERVAEGEWESARELPRTERATLRTPHDRLAAVLGGRDALLACEELVLRARADLDHGRTREAALQASIALAAALAELEAWREHGDMAARVDELAGHRAAVDAAAAAALEAAVDPPAVAAVEAAVARLEAALRARPA